MNIESGCMRVPPLSVAAGGGPRSTLPTAQALPLELWGEIAKQLAPQSFVAMTSACTAWRSFCGSVPVTQAVLHHSRIKAPTSRMGHLPPNATCWSEILSEARLLTRLSQMPLTVLLAQTFADALPAIVVSPDMQHVLVQDKAGLALSMCGVYALSGRNIPPLYFSAADSLFHAQFTAWGKHLILQTHAQGPIPRFDLSLSGALPQTIAPAAPYLSGGIVDANDGKRFIISCSDGWLRTFTATAQQTYLQTDAIDLGIDCALMGVSTNEQTYVVQTADEFVVYEKTATLGMRRIGQDTMPCCGDLLITPMAHFIETFSQCSPKRSLYAVNPHPSHPAAALRKEPPCDVVCVSPDEKTIAVRKGANRTRMDWIEPNDKDKTDAQKIQQPAWLQDFLYHQANAAWIHADIQSDQLSVKCSFRKPSYFL